MKKQRWEKSEKRREEERVRRQKMQVRGKVTKSHKVAKHRVFPMICVAPEVLRATAACTLSTSELPNVLRPGCVLYILTWRCASRHKGVHFSDISTSKRAPAPTLVCFAHFDLDMCFAPQRRLRFRHLNFQKWSETVSFLR